jgi:succinate dehydrogenase / fumarate reductase flavoprotein subunit/fumarate reductase flavoprotein subunit
VEEIVAQRTEPLKRSTGTNPFALRKELQELNWNRVGLSRQETDLSEAVAGIESLSEAAADVKVVGGAVYNMMYTAALDLRNMIDVSRMVAASARGREETRGAHFRQDFPEQRDDYGLYNIHLRRGEGGTPILERRPVTFHYKTLEECRRYRKAPKPPEDE